MDWDGLGCNPFPTHRLPAGDWFGWERRGVFDVEIIEWNVA